MPPEEVAAIFVEPIQGEGGYIVPPPEFHKELYKIARKYNILYVADEVQSGMAARARCLPWSTSGGAGHHRPGKGIASGMPLGATIARTEIMDWEAGSHASTFAAIPSPAKPLWPPSTPGRKLMANAAVQGERMIRKLQDMQKNYECMGDVRGKGLMIGVELVKTERPRSVHRSGATSW